jgi:hypothetical protein
MDIKEMIKEAHDSADKAIKEAQQNATVWYRRPCNVSNGQALLFVAIALLVIFAF